MIDEKFEKLLTRGLLAGYAGESNLAEVKRANFFGTQSDFKSCKDEYHDEWFASEIGGGQELVQIEDRKFTRVYAGGALNKKSLELLGIEKDDVADFLKKSLVSQAEKTRLNKDALSDPEGEWQYFYKVLRRDTEIPIILGRESIMYKGTEVHIHYFLICPIK